jgi:lipopolysaccharide transport system ATP-binding protein
MDAIVIENVTKHFRKSTIQHHTTLKTEVVRWFRRQRRQLPQMFIESLKGVSLRIPQGKTMGIIGRNGAGKSTLLKIITGIYSPSSGTVQVRGRISALLDLGAGFHPDFSGRENILINGIILGMSRSEIRARMQTIIDFSELGDFIDEPVRTYSSGMYMRLAFSVATHVDPDILLIDEILSVGDEHFSRKSRAKMNEFKKSGKTIVLITHDLGTVQAWCDIAAWIDEGRVRSIGDPREVVAQYRQAVEFGEAHAATLAPANSAEPAFPQLHPAETEGLAANGRAHFALQLKRVQLLDQLGREARILEPNEGLDVVIEFETSEDLLDVGFSIRIFHSEGLLVYGTNSLIESVALPNPLPRSGMLRFTIERLGLGGGTYSLDIAVQNRAGIDYDSSKGVCSFSVSSTTQETGIVRLPHRWSFVGRDYQASEIHPITGS